MRLEILILAIGGLFAYNIYTEGKLVKQVMLYKKYFTIAGIVILSLFLCWLFRSNPQQARSLIHVSADYMKYMPTESGASLLSPLLKMGSKWGENGSSSNAGYFGGGGGNNNIRVAQSSGTFNQQQGKFKRSVSESKKKFVAARQDWKCAVCRQKLPPTLEIDHIFPLNAGGSNSVDNLQAVCPNCHREKTLMDNL